MRISKIIALLIISSLMNTVSAQNYILQGIIGKKIAILSLVKEGKEIYDAKYYLAENRDVVLLEANYIDATNLILYSLDANNEDTLSRFYLKFEDQYRQLNGTFMGNDGLKEEAYFNWLDITKIKHNYASNNMVKSFKTEIPFLYTYTSDLKFDANVKEVLNGKFDKITIVKNKANSIPSLRFVAASSAEKKIEAFCDSIGLEQIVAAIDCGMEYEVRLTVKRFDQHIISLEYYVSWFCGGAYPDSYTQGYTFNRKTGEQITLSRLFNLADEETSNDSLNKLAIQANEAIIRSMVKETLKNDGGSLCDYDNYPLFGEKNFYIDKTNIHFLPDFPRALAACRDSKLSHVRLSKVKTLMDASLQPLFLE